MDFNEILKHLGDFGFYQKRILFLASLIGIPAAFNNVGSVFLAATMDHWCAIPDADRFNCSTMTESHECQQLKLMSIPAGKDESVRCVSFSSFMIVKAALLCTCLQWRY